jgi:hypothetical protein
VVSLALGLGVAASAASATVYSGSETFDAPAGTPSLTGPTPDPAQTAEYLQTLSASYDDQAGSVTISFGLYDPATWGPVLSDGDGGSGTGGQLLSPPVSFELGYLGDLQHPTTDGVLCNPGGLPGVNQPQLGSPVLSVGIASNYNPDGSFSADTADASLEGYTGDIAAPVSFDGTTFTATVQNEAFRGHVWDCLVLNYGTEVPLSPPAPPSAPPTLLNPWGGTFTVRPRLIGLSGDGSSFIAGAKQHGRQSASNPGWYGRIDWSSWTATEAVGSGANWLDNCKPACVNGTYYAHSARLRAYDPQNGRFTRVWTRIRWQGRWRTRTLKLVHYGSSWYWE